MALENLGENQVLIFTNTGKEGKQPDFTGEVDVNGERFRIALWEKEFGNGTGFSGNISPLQEGSGGGKQQSSKGSGGGLKPRPKPSRQL